MSKILMIGDPHLKINDFQRSIDFLRWIESEIESNRPDIVCNLGDAFHDHAVVRSELMKEFKDHVYNTLQYTGQYWYVLGNHDCSKPKDKTYHALQPFNIDNFHVFDEVRHINDMNITVVPYTHRIDDFPTDTNSICITHNTFIGADYGFKREDCGIDADNVSADIIISGHIHKKQQFGKVVYPGTPFAHSASDIDQVKGVMLFDTHTHELEFIESPFPTWRSIEFEFDSEKGVDELHSTLMSELNDTDKWILKITGPRNEVGSYLKSRDYLDLIDGKDVTSKIVPTDALKRDVQIKSTSVEDIMSEYVDKIYDGDVDKQLILRKVLDIVNNTHS